MDLHCKCFSEFKKKYFFDSKRPNLLNFFQLQIVHFRLPTRWKRAIRPSLFNLFISDCRHYEKERSFVAQDCFKMGIRWHKAKTRYKSWILNCYETIWNKYSGDLKSDHLKSGNIWNTDFLKVGFQMVRFSNGRDLAIFFFF